MAQFKYDRIEAELRGLAATLPVGTRLPAERTLAATFGCHFMTVRRALKNLVDDGSIVRKLGSGTFVAERKRRPRSPSTSHRIGLLVHRESNMYAHRVLQAIIEIAPEEGANIRSRWARDVGDDGLEQARELAREGCEAIVLPWFPHHHLDDIRTFVEACELPISLPLVIAGLEKHYFGDPKIFGEAMLTTTRTLAAYFQHLGFGRIALLGPDVPEDPLIQKMLTAYTSFAVRENLAPLCGLVGSGGRAMDELAGRWAAYRGELAVISYDDEQALRFMTAMHKLGLSAPGDFAIVGHNDTDAARFSDPPLTSISQDFSHISRWLIRNAVALSQGASAQVQGSAVDRLIIRESCGGQGKITDTLRNAVPALELVGTESRVMESLEL